MHGAKAPAGGCIILLGATWQGISGLLATGFGSESCQRGVPLSPAFYHPDSDGARESERLQQPAGSCVGVDRGVLARGDGGTVLSTEATAAAQRRLTTHEQVRGRAGDS